MELDRHLEPSPTSEFRPLVHSSARNSSRSDDDFGDEFPDVSSGVHNRTPRRRRRPPPVVPGGGLRLSNRLEIHAGAIPVPLPPAKDAIFDK